MTKIKHASLEVDVSCKISKADTIPSYELLEGVDSYDSIDYVCNSSHFVRLTPKKDLSGKLIGAEPASSQKETDSFLDSYKATISNFPDVDKEQAHNLISFTNIAHPFGTAISIRIIIEDFLKDNFLSPAIMQFLGADSLKKLQEHVKTNGTSMLVEAITRITIKRLFAILKGEDPGRNGLKSKIEKAVKEYVVNDPIGSQKNLDKITWEVIQAVFDLTSGAVHGRRYDAIQLFRSSKEVFDAIIIYFGKGGKWK